MGYNAFPSGGTGSNPAPGDGYAALDTWTIQILLHQLYKNDLCVLRLVCSWLNG